MILEKIKSEKDDLNLSVSIIEPKGEAKGIVQISHGMAEHKERYYDFMKYLSENGYICVIHDHRGHGASVKDKKDLGYFYSENIDFIVDDLYKITKYIKNKYPNLKVTLFSHSMGTLVARNYLKKYDDEINKIILCGPPTKNSLSTVGIIIAKILTLFYKKNTPNKILNNMTFGNYNKKEKLENGWISENIENVKNYNEDKLCGYIFTTNGFINLYKLMKKAFDKKDWKLKNKELKLYVIAGENDPVIQNKIKFEKLVKFLKEIGYRNVKAKLYKNMKHEILNEKDNKKVYEDILNFINE